MCHTRVHEKNVYIYTREKVQRFLPDVSDFRKKVVRISWHLFTKSGLFLRLGPSQKGGSKIGQKPEQNRLFTGGTRVSDAGEVPKMTPFLTGPNPSKGRLAVGFPKQRNLGSQTSETSDGKIDKKVTKSGTDFVALFSQMWPDLNTRSKMTSQKTCHIFDEKIR